MNTLDGDVTVCAFLSYGNCLVAHMEAERRFQSSARVISVSLQRNAFECHGSITDQEYLNVELTDGSAFELLLELTIHRDCFDVFVSTTRYWSSDDRDYSLLFECEKLPTCRLAQVLCEARHHVDCITPDSMLLDDVRGGRYHQDKRQ